MSQQHAGPKLSYTVDDALAVTGLNRNAFYRAISTNQIATFKVGKRRMVSARALQDFIERKESEASGRRVATA
jgi:hypothetical protein